MPGEVGNFAVAGHRSPGLFWDLDKIEEGDEIIVEDRKARYVYRAENRGSWNPPTPASSLRFLGSRARSPGWRG